MPARLPASRDIGGAVGPKPTRQMNPNNKTG